VDPLHPLHTHYAFLGEMVDMRGHPHGPLNAWVLGSLIAVFGGVREAPFHAAYIVFSLMAALATLALARRFAPERALWAALLFIAVPAFVVNGNSFESDLVFLAFWMAAIACFVRAADTRGAGWLAASAAAAALAALDAFQAGMLTPILGLYLWLRHRRWVAGWLAALAAPVTILAWQFWEWAGGGVLPAAVLFGYMQSGALQSAGRKLASAAALTAHAGWIVCPALVALAFARSAGRLRWAAVGAVAAAAAAYDPNPLFWASIAMGALLVASCVRREFLGAWVALFFAASLLIFFAGSARYLLPLAAPVAILTARAVPPRWLAAGFTAQLALGLGLQAANAEHWSETRAFAAEVMEQAQGRRVWPAALSGSARSTAAVERQPAARG
jgi:4-amino-4-deoxy-L-arabinose transferase-like glycosyltransferase